MYPESGEWFQWPFGVSSFRPASFVWLRDVSSFKLEVTGLAGVSVSSCGTSADREFFSAVKNCKKKERNKHGLFKKNFGEIKNFLD